MTAAPNAWAAGSLAVVVPVATSGPLARTPATSAPGWDLRGLRRQSTQQPLPNPNVVFWDRTSDEHVASVVAPDRHQLLLRLAAGDDRPLPESAAALTAGLPPGIARISAVQVLEFDSGPASAGGTFLVLHVEIMGAGLEDPAAVAAYFAHPTRPGKQAEEIQQARARIDHQALTALLTSTDLGVPLATSTGVLRRPYEPYVVSHLVPTTSPLPPPDVKGPHSAPLEHVWARRMTTGSNLTVRSESADDRAGGFWLGSTWCLPTEHGISLVATRGLRERPTSGGDDEGMSWNDTSVNVEHIRLEGFAHCHAVDFAVLALRQTSYLRRHAAALGALTVSWDAGPPYRAALDLQRNLLTFRHRQWFTQVPEDNRVTCLLAGLHRALGTGELLGEIRDEQDQLEDALRLSAREVAEAEAAREALDREAAAAHALALADHAASKQRVLETIVAFIAAALAVPTFVYGYAQVAQPPHDIGPFASTVIAVAGALVSATLILLTIRFLVPDPPPPPTPRAAPPTSTSRPR